MTQKIDRYTGESKSKSKSKRKSKDQVQGVYNQTFFDKIKYMRCNKCYVVRNFIMVEKNKKKKKPRESRMYNANQITLIFCFGLFLLTIA